MTPQTLAAACQCLACMNERGDKCACGCGFPLFVTRMVVCETCGNKRCPHSDDHRNACTGSNAPGQKGSRYQ